MRAMKTYNNSLIAGVVNGQTGCEIWEYYASGKSDKNVFNQLFNSKILLYFKTILGWCCILFNCLSAAWLRNCSSLKLSYN